MAQSLTIFVGNYRQIMQIEGESKVKRYPTIIGQSTETNDEMVKKGENIGLMMLGESYEELILFTNNDHFLNGIRIACAQSRVDHESIRICFLPDNQSDFTKIHILSDGHIDIWPKGFFDTSINSMRQLTKLRRPRCNL